MFIEAKTIDMLLGNRGGFRISGKGVHMFKGVCVRFADFKYPMKMKNFIFIGYLKLGRGGRGSLLLNPPLGNHGLYTYMIFHDFLNNFLLHRLILNYFLN